MVSNNDPLIYKTITDNLIDSKFYTLYIGQTIGAYTLAMAVELIIEGQGVNIIYIYIYIYIYKRKILPKLSVTKTMCM